MPYEPSPGATVKEILFDPGNMVFTFCSGIALGFFRNVFGNGM
jgi:hypothetical protein